MEITWDERKRLANIDKHGFDFALLTEEFFFVSIIRPAKNRRFMAIGHFGELSIAVIFRPLGSEGVSLVSMRHANPKERRLLNDGQQAS
jgi:uncharacterized DUF497 family protein